MVFSTYSSSSISGVAGQFIGAMFTSHFYIIVFLTQVVGGLLLLANRYVPLGLLLLGAVIVNILNFHISMSTGSILLALVATALWLIVFSRMRGVFSGVFVQRVPDQSAETAGSPALGSYGDKAKLQPREDKGSSGNHAA